MKRRIQVHKEGMNNETKNTKSQEINVKWRKNNYSWNLEPSP